MFGIEVKGLKAVIETIADLPIASERKQIALCFGAARKRRKEWQRERKIWAPRSVRPRRRRRAGRRRGRRRARRLRNVRVWIPRSKTLDTWPIIKVVGPRHLVPTNATGEPHENWLRLDNIQGELSAEMESGLRAWLRQRQRQTRAS